MRKILVALLLAGLPVLDALAHGPGRKLKAEVASCPASGGEGPGLHRLCVENNENQPLRLTVALVAGEVMADGRPVCIPSRLMPGGVQLPEAGGESALILPAGERRQVIVRLPVPLEAPACLQARLAPAEPPPEDHGGHLKPMSTLIFLGTR